MPVLVKYVNSGLNPADYDKIRRILEWERDPPGGGLFHSIWFDGDRMTEVDVWEDRASFDSYVANRFKPTLAREGFQVSEPEVVELYNLAAGPGLARYAFGAAPA